MHHVMGGQLPPEWIEERIMQEINSVTGLQCPLEVMEGIIGNSVEEGGRGDRANESGVLLDKMFENAIEIEPNQTYPLSWAVYKDELARSAKQKKPTIRNEIIDKITDAMIDIEIKSPEYRNLETDKVIELAWKRVIAD